VDEIQVSAVLIALMSHKEPQNSLITEVAIGLKSFSIDAVVSGSVKTLATP
jgi:hypothetical protein